MTQPTSDAVQLLQLLLALEQELTSAVMLRASANVIQIPDNETLGELKAVIDRLRPLLWIYLTRAGVRQEPLTESVAMKPAVAS